MLQNLHKFAASFVWYFVVAVNEIASVTSDITQWCSRRIFSKAEATLKNYLVMQGEDHSAIKYPTGVFLYIFSLSYK